MELISGSLLDRRPKRIQSVLIIFYYLKKMLNNSVVRTTKTKIPTQVCSLNNYQLQHNKIVFLYKLFYNAPK